MRVTPGIDRREFLQLAAGGLLLSVTAVRTAVGATAQQATFTSDGFSLTLQAPRGGSAHLQSLRNNKTGFEWVGSAAMEPVFSASGQSVRDWATESGRSNATSAGDRFEFAARSKAAQITAKTSLQAFRDAPILEFQAEFKNAARRPNAAVQAFGPFRIALRKDLGPLRLHALRRNEYGLEVLPVEKGVDVSGGGWNAPQYAGLLLLEAVGKDEFLLIGIECERGWHYRIEDDADGPWLSVYVGDLTHDMAPDETLTTPRVFIGLAHGTREQAFHTARHYLQDHVFPASLKDWPWVVYDFWATDGEGVEDALLREVQFSKNLGVDVFVIDASWYRASSKKGTGDWGCGLGNYEDDRVKFPMGLAAISRRVHASGMKFGLWVGPNVVDSRLMGTTIPKKWAAQSDGKDRSMQPRGWESSVTQVCLGCPEYVDYLQKQLTRIVREYRLDWLKWDNSGIPGSPAHCNRADHGHQAGDASYASLLGQYQIFNHLHETFPGLVLEQCGYGSRLDYGLARTIRSNWLSDASYPSERVRHNAMIASYLYPSGDNGAWIVVEDEALLKNVNDPAALDTICRSRMLCLFGFGTLGGLLKERISLLPDAVLDAARRNLLTYKQYRHLLVEDCYHLVEEAKDQPQAIQFTSRRGDESVVFAFQAGSGKDVLQLPLRGLRDTANYELTFASRRQKLNASGQDLRSAGTTVRFDRLATSEIILLRISDT